METLPTTPAPALSPTPAALLSHPGATDTMLRLRYDALTRQLETARTGQARLEARLFAWLCLSAGTLLGIYIAGSTLFPSITALLPFLVVSSGVQAAFILHNIEFSRFCAAKLEERLNQLLDGDVLVTARLEDAFGQPLGESKMATLLARPERFHVACSLHWACVWLFFFIAGALEAGRTVPEGQRFFYATMLASWAGMSGVYLLWQMSVRHGLSAMEAVLPKEGPINGKASD
ncbi:MAG TPA: hypothetical protein VK970_19285 [Candidatus Methylacidiphilales bacterium]|nr:hypothetical protein [Candidatus Methylacidiphilales bacterium]